MTDSYVIHYRHVSGATCAATFEPLGSSLQVSFNLRLLVAVTPAEMEVFSDTWNDWADAALQASQGGQPVPPLPADWEQVEGLKQ